MARAIILLTLALFLISAPFLFQGGEAVRPETTISAEVEADNVTWDNALEKLAQGFVDIFDTIINAITSVIMVPVNAFSTIVGNWAGTLGSWWAPLLAVVVIIVVLFLVRLYVMFDSGLDTFNDWISGGNN